ncbi:MAG: hypothetical protein J0H68_02240 [Sphingobacteriia bacterium]|nr:hypothetical protein [Sphingobacteriia bacterium]
MQQQHSNQNEIKPIFDPQGNFQNVVDDNFYRDFRLILTNHNNQNPEVILNNRFKEFLYKLFKPVIKTVKFDIIRNGNVKTYHCRIEDFNLDEYIKNNREHPLFHYSNQTAKNQNLPIGDLFDIITSNNTKPFKLTYNVYTKDLVGKTVEEFSVFDIYFKGNHVQEFIEFYQAVYKKNKEFPNIYPELIELSNDELKAIYEFAKGQVETKNEITIGKTNWDAYLIKALTKQPINDDDKNDFDKNLHNYFINLHHKINKSEKNKIDKNLFQAFQKLGFNLNLLEKFNETSFNQKIYSNVFTYLLDLERDDCFEITKSLLDSLNTKEKKRVIETLKNSKELTININCFNDKYKLWKKPSYIRDVLTIACFALCAYMGVNITNKWLSNNPETRKVITDLSNRVVSYFNRETIKSNISKIIGR